MPAKKAVKSEAPVEKQTKKRSSSAATAESATPEKKSVKRTRSTVNLSPNTRLTKLEKTVASLITQKRKDPNREKKKPNKYIKFCIGISNTVKTEFADIEPDQTTLTTIKSIIWQDLRDKVVNKHVVDDDNEIQDKDVFDKMFKKYLKDNKQGIIDRLKEHKKTK